MELIDTHCHITDNTQEEVQAILDRAAHWNVTKVICVGAINGTKAAFQAVKQTKQFDNVYCSVGVHPHDATQILDLNEIAHLANEEKVVAIGETGLDYFRDWSPFENQKILFRNTISLAKEVRKPLIIHCRDAADDTLAILKEENAQEVGGVFHCYAQDSNFAKKIIDMGFLASFTGNLTFKKAENLRVAAKEIPLTQIMVETDAPYMAPEPFRGKPSEPKHVLQVAETIAKVKGISLTEVAKATTENANNLFGLKLT
jgi:TatD DNase family protein